METLILLAVLAVLLLLRVPVAIALAISALLVLPSQNYGYESAITDLFNGLNNISLMAIPGFVFAGILMAKGGISKYLIECLRSWIGHIPGGMAVVCVLACAIFASISGSSPATAAAIGSIMIPGMVQAGYSKKYAIGLVAVSGTLGILIPPSITLIVYGYVAEQKASIGKLFTAGILPGLFFTFTLVVSAILYAKRNKFGSLPKASWKERWVSTANALPAAIMPVFILGSIYSGIVTPTEAAVLSCLYACLVSVFVYKEITWRSWRPIITETGNLTAMIFLVIAAATLFKQYLTLSQVPQLAMQWIAETEMNKYLFLLLVNLLFLILGAFLESVSIVLLTLPILLPMLGTLGIDVYHFAIIMTINMEIAMITPPVGLNLFVVSGIAKESFEKTVAAVMPFLWIMLLNLVIVALWPGLSLSLIQ